MQRLYEKIKHLPKIDRIVAIGRGGLVPACLLSRLMGIHKVDTVGIWAYDCDNKKVGLNPEQIRTFDYIKGEHVLLLDDLVSGGDTMHYAKNYLESFNPSNVTTAVLIEKGTAKFKPDFSVAVVGSDTQIEFFWENNFDFEQRPLSDEMWKEVK